MDSRLHKHRFFVELPNFKRLYFETEDAAEAAAIEYTQESGKLAIVYEIKKAIYLNGRTSAEMSDRVMEHLNNYRNKL